MEAQTDEEDALGPAAPLVAEWRELRVGAGSARSRIDQAGTSVRRWELEVAMLRDFHLTLPPETEPLDASRREDHLRWRQEGPGGGSARVGEGCASAMAETRRYPRFVVAVGRY